MTAQKKPNQADILHGLLVARREQGVHTFEIRREFIGNPSQRRQELEDRGVQIVVGPKEKLNGRADGVRYWLAEYAPVALQARRAAA